MAVMLKGLSSKPEEKSQIACLSPCDFFLCFSCAVLSFPYPQPSGSISYLKAVSLCSVKLQPPGSFAVLVYLPPSQPVHAPVSYLNLWEAGPKGCGFKGGPEKSPTPLVN